MHFKTGKRLTTLRKRLKGCDVRASIDPPKAFDYCQKEATRAEGHEAVVFGERPEPVKKFCNSTKEKTAEINARALDEGPEALILDGTVHIKDYPKLKAGVNHFKLHTLVLESLEHLENVWCYGPTGVGKSRSFRERYGQSLFVKDPNKWWDGY